MHRATIGLLCGLLVLLPALLAAELILRGYEHRLLDDAHLRAQTGLDGVFALIDAERTRTLDNAETTAGRLSVTAQNGPSDELAQAAADLRTALRTSLVAVVDAGGHTLGSDPASNLPFGSQGAVKSALQGKSAVSLENRNPGVAIQASAPLRSGSTVLPGAAVVAQTVDDSFLINAQRMTGVESALVQKNRVVAASRGLRRSIAFAPDPAVDQALLESAPGDVQRARVGTDSFLILARGVGPAGREIATAVVALPVEAIDGPLWQAREMADGAALLGAAMAGLLGAWAAGRLTRQMTHFARAVQALGTPGMGTDAPLPAHGLWAEARASLHAARQQLLAHDADQQRRLGLLEGVLDSLTEGVVMVDTDQRVVLINSAARVLLNLPPGGDDRALATLAEDPQHAVDAQSSSQRVIRSYSAPVLDAQGQPVATVTVLRDTTREQELDRLKSEFLAGVSHELQTPLTAIKGALELVIEEDEGGLSRVQRRFLDTMRRHGERLAGLVSDLLDFSRLEAGRVELDVQPLDAGSVVESTVASLSELFAVADLAVEVQVPSAVPPILADRRRLEQVLTNLLANAAKYTPRGGHILVSAETRNGHVALSVADSGPGIPQVERELVFDRFYRGRGAARSGERGTGLGLAIVKSLVELHHGSVHVENARSPLTGARFVVELPRATDVD